MAADEDIRIRIGYNTDTQNVAVASQGAQTISSGFDSIGESVRVASEAVRFFESGGINQVAAPFQEVPRVTHAATQSLEELEVQQDRVIKGLRDYAKANETAEQAIERLRKEEAERGRTLGNSPDDIERSLLQRSSQDTPQRREVGSLGRFGRELRNLPAIGLGGNLTTDAIGKVLYAVDGGLTAIGATAAQVGAASLVAAPALIGLVLAMKTFNETVEAGKQALTGALTAQTAYYEALQTKTTQQVTQELADLERRADALAQQRQELERAVESAFSQAAAQFSDPVARAMDAAGQLPTAQLREQLKQINAAYEANIQTSARYRQGLEENAFALNDQRERTQSFAEAVQEALNAGDTSGIQALIQQREQTMQYAQAAINILQQSAAAAGDTETSIQAYNEAIDAQRRVIFDAQQDIHAYTLVLEDSGLAAQRAAELAQAAAEANGNAGARWVIAYREFERDITAMTRDERAQRRRELGERQKDLEYLTATLRGDELEAARAELNSVIEQLRLLAQTSETAADRLRHAQNGIALGSERAEAAAERMQTANDQFLDAQEAFNNANADLAQARMQSQALEADYRADQVTAAADYSSKLAQIAAASEDKRTEIITKGEAERARILRQSNASLALALGQRDAVAAYMIRLNRDQQLTDQKERESVSLKQADAAANDQRETAQAHYRDALSDLQRRYAQEKATRDQAIAQAKVDVQNAEYNLKMIHDQYNSVRIAAEINTQNQVMSVIQQGGNAIVAQWGAIATASMQAIHAANAANQRAVLPAGGAAPRTGGSYTINVSGAQARTISVLSRESALRVMSGIFGQMGITE